MREVRIEGFTSAVSYDTKPAICVFGEESSGTTRFGCSLPHDDGVIGWLAIDYNSKPILDLYKKKWKFQVAVNSKPFLDPSKARKLLALSDERENGAKESESEKQSKLIYTDVLDRITDACANLSANPDVESIVIDRLSQIFDYSLFAHHGRKTQIEGFQRSSSNQDMVDLISLCRNKNLALLCKHSEVYKDTGAKDRYGRPISIGTGRYKPEGFGKIGQFVTAVLELKAKRTKPVKEDDEEALKDKYRCVVHTTKGNVMLEGTDLYDSEYEIGGEMITWDNVVRALGIGGAE